VVIPSRRRFARKAERGTTVVVVVLVTTLITAIGVFAVRNVNQVDRAVGYSRQAAQSIALAELGTTAAMAEVASKGGGYTANMTGGLWCLSNGRYAKDTSSSCYKLDRAALEAITAANNGETLLEPAGAGETGSFGPLGNTTGVLQVELTDKHSTNTPIPGGGEAFDVTLTTMASVTPIPTSGSSDPCADGVATMAVTKVVRAHMIVPAN
jgi:hypothetical protein